jgi:hypothetical protein
MFLRVKDGFYAGQIREFAPEAGRALVAAGRAENPYAEPPRVDVRPPTSIPVSPKKKGRK